MGQVHPSIDPALLAIIVRSLPPARFIETGSYEGDGVAAAQPYFTEIHTVEADEELYEGIKARFGAAPGIAAHLGHSPEVLESLALSENNAQAPTVYWLDAHWCEGLRPVPPLCPLLDELAAIRRLGENDVVLIDDARYFLSSPPAPHPSDDWPEFEDVLGALRDLSGAHRLQVIDDVFVFAPPRLMPALRSFAHQHARDLLAIVTRATETSLPIRPSPAKSEPAPHAELHALHDQIENVQQSLGALSAQITTLQIAQAEQAKQAAEAAGTESNATAPPAPAPPAPLPEAPSWARPIARAKYQLNKLNRLQHHEPKKLRLPARYSRERMPDDPPSIAIVTPSLNQGRFIGNTVASVLDQAYPSLEYIVLDGGSTDATDQVMEPWITRLHHYESAPDGGQAEAINAGHARTSGEIMAYLNSDDLLLPGSLAVIARWFDEHPETDVVYGHRIIIDRFGDEIGRWVLPSHDDGILSLVDYVPQETLFWRRSIWDRVGGIDESFRFAMDWDLLVRFRDAGAKIERIPRFLGAFRIHDEQKTAALNEAHGLPEMDRIRLAVHGHEMSNREILDGIRPYLLRHMLADRLWRAGLRRY